MAEDGEKPEKEVGAVVDCILVNYPGGSESRDKVVRAILAWAAEYPDEWDELRARCQQRHVAPA